MSSNGPAWPLRRLLRRAFGLWPVLELGNRIVMSPSLPRLIALENREVSRLLGELGARPAARIAVIMPTYKRPASLLNAVDSVLKQDVQDFVIMVVDDGAGLPKLPADPRVFGVSLSRNSAVLGLVRNVGIRLTKSRFIAFLDDDNTWRPDHLTLTLGALEAGADFVYTDLRRRTADGVDIDVLSADFDRRTYADRSNTVDSNAIALRRTKRAIFSRLPRTRHTLPKEDWEFVWRQTRGARVHHIAEPTVNYLVNQDSYYTNWKVETGTAGSAS